jgi:hypothetical protein
VIALFAAAHLYLFQWQGEAPKALFMLPMEGENACGVGPINFGPPDNSWSSGSAGSQASCEFRQVVQPDALLPAWIDAGKVVPGGDVEVGWTLLGERAKGTGHKATLKVEVVAPDALRSTTAGLSATAVKVKNDVRVEVRNGGQGPVLIGDAVAARNRPDDSCVGSGPQVLLKPGETLVDTRPGLLSKSMQVWVAAFTAPRSCRWVQVQRR